MTQLGPKEVAQPTSRDMATQSLGCPRPERYAGLWPLVPLALSTEATAGLSRREIKELRRYVDRATTALNFMHGEPQRPPPRYIPAVDGKRNTLQLLTQRHLETHARAWVGVERALEPEKCLDTLLKGRSPYGSESSASLAAYSYSRLSLPNDLSKAPAIERLLTAGASKMLKGFNAFMLRPLSETDALRELRQVRPYTDPTLKNNSRKYAKLVHRALGTGLVELSLDCICELGIFFVKKNDKIRLILDCRLANLHFLSPPSVELLTGEGLSNIEFESTTDEPLLPTDVTDISLGIADVSDCFHRCKLLPTQGGHDIRKYFCWPRILAGDLGVSRVKGKDVHPNTPLWPMNCSLPMGFTWSLYFAQNANLSRLLAQPSLRQAHLLTDRGSPWQLCRRRGDTTEASSAQLGCYVYVDNLGVGGEPVDAVKDCIMEAQSSFNAAGA